MTPHHMDGLLFARAEFLALMDAVGPEGLIGINEAELIPSDRATLVALVQEGIIQLGKRGLLQVQGGIHLLHPELMEMAWTVAFPELVTLLVKDVPDLGQQKFVYYQAGPLIVEHTMPEADMYRLGVVPNTTAQLERMAFVLPAGEGGPGGGYREAVPQDAFFGAREQVLQGEGARAARTLVAQGLSVPAAEALVAAMQTARFSGTVAFLRTEAPDVVDARNLAVLQGADSAWVAEQVVAGQPTLSVRTLEGDALKETLFAALRSLVQPAAEE